MDKTSVISISLLMTAAVCIGIAIRLDIISEAAFWGLS